MLRKCNRDYSGSLTVQRSSGLSCNVQVSSSIFHSEFPHRLHWSSYVFVRLPLFSPICCAIATYAQDVCAQTRISAAREISTSYNKLGRHAPMLLSAHLFVGYQYSASSLASACEIHPSSGELDGHATGPLTAYIGFGYQYGADDMATSLGEFDGLAPLSLGLVCNGYQYATFSLASPASATLQLLCPPSLPATGWKIAIMPFGACPRKNDTSFDPRLDGHASVSLSYIWIGYQDATFSRALQPAAPFRLLCSPLLPRTGREVAIISFGVLPSEIGTGFDGRDGHASMSLSYLWISYQDAASSMTSQPEVPAHLLCPPLLPASGREVAIFPFGSCPSEIDTSLNELDEHEPIYLNYLWIGYRDAAFSRALLPIAPTHLLCPPLTPATGREVANIPLGVWPSELDTSFHGLGRYASISLSHPFTG